MVAFGGGFTERIEESLKLGPFFLGDVKQVLFAFGKLKRECYSVEGEEGEEEGEEEGRGLDGAGQRRKSERGGGDRGQGER